MQVAVELVVLLLVSASSCPGGNILQAVIFVQILVNFRKLQAEIFQGWLLTLSEIDRGGRKIRDKCAHEVKK